MNPFLNYSTNNNTTPLPLSHSQLPTSSSSLPSFPSARAAPSPSPAPAAPTATTTHAAFLPPPDPVVPNKRKRAGTSAGGKANLHYHQQQQQQQQPHPPNPNAFSTPPRPPSSARQQATTHTTSSPATAAAGAPPLDDSIRCICTHAFDDGFSIMCDVCQLWSHGFCYGVSSGTPLPDSWVCARCEPARYPAFSTPEYRERLARVMKARKREMTLTALANAGVMGPPPVPGSAGAVNGVNGVNGSAGTMAVTTTTTTTANGGRKRGRRASLSHPVAPGMARSNNSSGQGASAAGPSSSSTAGPLLIAGAGAEEEHVDIEDDWRTAYVHTDVDLVPHRQTRDRLKACAQNWRGMHALSPSPSASASTSPKTRVVPLSAAKTDISASVRPPSYALRTTAPIAGQGLVAPYASTVVPSSVYLADPLNAYAHLGQSLSPS